MQARPHRPQAPSREPFVVMAKPAGPRCNMSCSYCYYLDTEVGETAGGLLSDSLLETYIRQYIAAHPGPVLQFTWHGGEPTLAGIDFYRRAIELQQRYLPKGWSCWNNLQTNGLLLDDAWCAFLAEHRFDVGISIDGHRPVHDHYRLDAGGHGTYDRVAAAVERLKRHGIRPDLLCTVTSLAAADPLAVYRALKRFRTGWIQFIPIVVRTGDGLSDSSVSAEAYGHFLCEIFDDWIVNDLGRIDVQLFAETAMVLAGGEASLCWMAPTCGRVLILEHEGGIYACDHFVDSAHRLGSIADGSSHLGELVDLPRQLSFGAAKRETLPQQCRACAWLRLCHGGCPKDRFIASEDGESGLNYLCRGLSMFFAHAQEQLTKLMALRQQGASPQHMLDHFRQERRAQWRGVAPKDPCPCGSGRTAKECCWHKRPSLAFER